MRNFLLFLMFSGPLLLAAQTVSVLDSGRNCSLRGLAVVSDSVFWVSGSNGTVGRCTDGQHIEWQTVPGYETKDFRDIEAFDANTAIILGIENPGILLKTFDGGKTWKKVFEKAAVGMFLDCMDFDSSGNGFAMGDPINGKFYVLQTSDWGDHWNEWTGNLPRPDSGEAMFASSGSNLQLLSNSPYRFCVVTGGSRARVIMVPINTNIPIRAGKLPMNQGKQIAGAHSWAANDKAWVVVGGDYLSPTNDTGSYCYSTNSGKSWQTGNNLGGYKSSVIFIADNSLLACGTTGVALSKNGLTNWKTIDTLAFHVAGKAANGSNIYLAGPRGRVGKVEIRFSR